MWLINLVENLLSVTRLEEGRLNLNMSAELVDEVVKEALNHVDRKSSEHTITVSHEDEFLLAPDGCQADRSGGDQSGK